MDMDVRLAVRIGYLLIINLGQPVVCGNRAGVMQNQSADRICDSGIFLNTPVLFLYIAVDNIPLI